MIPTLITLTPDTIAEHGLGCLNDKKHPGFAAKTAWFTQEYDHGCRIILAKDGKKTIGFIEYTPGEFFWRPVHAHGFLMIHCIWVYKKDLQHLGIGSQLIQSVIYYAKENGFAGVGTVASDGSWLATKDVFEKNGFINLDQKERFDLMIYPLTDDFVTPTFMDWDQNLKLSGPLTLTYSNQCPFSIKCAQDCLNAALETDNSLILKEIKSVTDVPSVSAGYGVVVLTAKQTCLADHYISATRFKNILKKLN